MTKTRNQKSQEGGSESDGTGSGSASGSDRPTECLPQVRKLMGIYNTPVRKGSGSTYTSKTPGSSRKMGPPTSRSQTPRSALRPTTSTSENQNGNGIGAGLRLLPTRESDPVEVTCRVKPLMGAGSEESCIRILSEQSVALIPPENSAVWRAGTAKEGHYSFQTVFDESISQKRIFDTVALPLVQDFVQGKNALLFAYGVTGSGKTYTMSGHGSDCGIMPRCLDVIFNSIAKFKATKYVFKPDRMNGFDSQSKADAMHERQKEIIEKTREAGRTPRSRARAQAQELEAYTSRIRDETCVPLKTIDSVYSVFVTYVEIYNNFVYDLLDESPIEMGKNQFGKGGLQSKMLREDTTHNVYVNGVTEVEVESPGDAFEVYQRGLRRRRMAHTALNTESSRSHSIFNIRLVQAPTDREGEEIVDRKELIGVSQLSLVDLAGSERYARTQATGDRLKEAGNINNSLMTLRKCMDILRENQQFGANRMVPYRDSKLTHFLKNYFEGEGRVRMILCVNPRNEDYDENIHVFTFAELTQEVQIHRPQEKKQVEFQTPGRMKANEMYKEAKRQLIEEKVIEDSDLPSSDTQFVFGLGFPIPLCRLQHSHEAELLSTLKKALEIRVKGESELMKYVVEKRESFRLRLGGLEREMENLRYENMNMKDKLERHEKEKSKQDNVLRAMMQEKSELEQRYDEQERHMKEMEEELLNLRMQFKQRDMQHFKEKQMLKSDMDLKRELDDLKRSRQLQKEEEKLKKEFKAKEQTLAAVRQLVSSVDLRETRSRRRSKSFGLLEDSMSTTTSSEPDLISASAAAAKSSKKSSTRGRAPSVPLLPIDNTNTPIGGFSRRGAGTGSGIPINRRPRARSTDQDVWIEHTAGMASKAGTVFQPMMKKKKSVNKLTKAEDITTKASKYCLRTQEQDSEGELETKLYKGDVMSTVGGGAQVIFNDVEVLRQESPTGLSPSRKRRSSGGGALAQALLSPFRNRDIRYDQNPEDIRDKCNGGISGGASGKRSRQN